MSPVAASGRFLPTDVGERESKSPNQDKRFAACSFGWCWFVLREKYCCLVTDLF
jgi:hypothetical protein